MYNLPPPVYIDDSGFSCLIGGAMIGFYDSRRKYFHKVILPLKYFREDYDNKRKIVDIITDITYSLVNDYAIFTQDIIMCRGDFFDKAEIKLKRQNYTIKREVIGDPLQTWLKNEHLLYLKHIGYPVRERNGYMIGQDTDAFADWVGEDFPNREHLVKSKHRCWQEVYKQAAMDKYNQKGG